jgi:hypothetical protein
MEENIERLLVRSYAMNFRSMCMTLLDLLKPTLSGSERKYVEKTGPDIAYQDRLHDIYTSGGFGSPEGRAAGRESDALQVTAKRDLSRSGVSEERQLLLWNLVLGSQYGGEEPREISHIERHMCSGVRDGTFARLVELARLVDTQGDVIRFLEDLYREASVLVEEGSASAKV